MISLVPNEQRITSKSDSGAPHLDVVTRRSSRGEGGMPAESWVDRETCSRARLSRLNTGSQPAAHRATRVVTGRDQAAVQPSGDAIREVPIRSTKYGVRYSSA